MLVCLINEVIFFKGCEVFEFKLVTVISSIVIIFLRVPAFIKFFSVICILFWYQINFAEFGPDYQAYKNHYQYLLDRYAFEEGYVLLVKFFKVANIPFVYFYSIINVIGMMLYFKLFYHELGGRKESVLLVIPFICFFFYSVQINAIRQSIAMLIVLYGLKYILKGWGGAGVFILIVSVASLFHRSSMFALIFPIVYIISRRKNDWMLLVLIISLILYLIKLDVTKVFFDYLVLVSDDSISQKIKFYTRVGQQNHFGVGFIDRIYLLLVILYVKINLVRLKLFDRRMSLYYGIGMTYLILQLLFFEYNFIFQRLKYYFLPVIFIYWVHYISATKKSHNKVVFFVLLLCYSLANFTLRNFYT